MVGPRNEFDWTPGAIDRLRTLWAEGHSVVEIGRRLGVSKNAVVGKAHRLGLTPRPSPITRCGEPRQPRRAGEATLPDGAPLPAPIALRTNRDHQELHANLPPAEPATVFRPRAPRECSAVEGDGRPWRYCDAPAVEGGSYCARHRAAYVASNQVRAARAVDQFAHRAG